jgi:hypothetical protein
MAERKAFVQTMRQLARSCDNVPSARDDASKEKVEEMAQKLAASSTLDEEGKRKAAEALRGYLATWAPTAAQARDQAAFKQRLRGTSFLLTYNWDFCHKDLPDGTTCPGTPGQLWRLWKTWKTQKALELGVKLSTSTLETSLHSSTPDRHHFHWKVNLFDVVDFDSTWPFNFHGIRPDARQTFLAPTKQARGANFLEASNRGHFYTWAPKLGTLYRGTNYKPWERYRVLGRWLDDLWTDGKLDHQTYDDLALRVRTGYQHRKRDMEMVRASEQEEQVNEQIQEVDQQLSKIKAPPLVFPQVRAWEESFLHLQFRWKLLVLVADSASGKSTFAEGLFEKPYVLTVEDADDLDLRSFDRDTHDGIVLDNVNSWQQLLNWRALLQARNAKSRGGQSKTNVYSYVQYLFGVAVVATVDLDAPDAYFVDPDSTCHSKWLLKNCTFVRLPAGETFYDRQRLPQDRLDNTFSRFAATVKRRRLQE